MPQTPSQCLYSSLYLKLLEGSNLHLTFSLCFPLYLQGTAQLPGLALWNFADAKTEQVGRNETGTQIYLTQEKLGVGCSAKTVSGCGRSSGQRGRREKAKEIWAFLRLSFSSSVK